MKVTIVKNHHKYSGTVDLLDGEANYLIATGVAKKYKAPKKEDKIDKTETEVK